MPAAVGHLQPRGQRGLHRGLERLRLLRRILAGFGLPGSCCGGAGAGLRRLLLLLALYLRLLRRWAQEDGHGA